MKLVAHDNTDRTLMTYCGEHSSIATWQFASKGPVNDVGSVKITLNASKMDAYTEYDWFKKNKVV